MWLQCPLSSSPSRLTSPPSVGCLAGTTFRSLLGPDSCWSPDLPASCRRRPLFIYLFMFVCVCVLCVSDRVFLCVYICCHDNLLSRYDLENSEEVGRGVASKGGGSAPREGVVLQGRGCSAPREGVAFQGRG